MRKQNASPTTKLASGALLAAALATAIATPGLPAWAAGQKTSPTADQKKMSQTESIAVSGWASPQMEQLARDSGHLLLTRVNAAADMIKAGDYFVANKELDAAMDTAGAIRTMMPYLVVVDQIKNAKNKLVAEGTEYLRDDLLPVYSQLDEMSLFAPDVATKAKHQVANAEDKANVGKKTEAAKNLDDAIETISATTVYLPVDYVYGQIAAARAALSSKKPDTETAMRAVQNARDSLVAVVTTVEGQPQS